MKNHRLSTALVAVLTMLVVITLAASLHANQARTLTGEYILGPDEEPGKLEAIFTPTGDTTWDVDFHFSFQGQPHTYSGIAEGSLGEGKLAGTVKDERQRRTFTFKGAFEAGTFWGTHAEIEASGEEPTGTLTLRESE